MGRVALGTVLLLGMACASTPERLTEAREKYDEAAESVEVVGNAPLELGEAARVLLEAEVALGGEAGSEEVTRLASLADTWVEIAVAATRLRIAERELGRAGRATGGEVGRAAGYPLVTTPRVEEPRTVAEGIAKVDRDTAVPPSEPEMAPTPAKDAELAASGAAEAAPAREVQADTEESQRVAQAREALEPPTERRAIERPPTEAANELAAELEDTIAAAEERLRLLEEANELAGLEIAELRAARELEEAQQVGPVGPRPAEEAPPALVEARRELDQQLALERQTREALELQEAEEDRERWVQQQLAIEEARAARTAAERAVAPVPEARQAPRDVAAAPEARARTSMRDAERDAERRARELEGENERLRATNDALLAIVEARDEAPDRVVERVDRRVVVEVDDEDDEPDVDLVMAREAERRRAAELAAREQETLADVAAARTEAERARERAAALEKERELLQEWNARLTDEGIVLTLADLFASGDTTPMPDERRSLQRIAALLQERPDRRVMIVGHTDATGPEELNLDLSLKRAEAVGRFLENQGVRADRIETMGAGEKQPIAPNQTPSGRKQNRRVEVILLDPVAESVPGPSGSSRARERDPDGSPDATEGRAKRDRS